MTTRYVAFITDVVGSRSLGARTRTALQNRLRVTAQVFNTRYRKHLAARFAVTLGDELQGLFTSAAPVWAVSHELHRAHPGARLAELARILHVGPSAISHLRCRMAWPLVAAGDKVFQELLDQ